ncbi:tyrosine-type recombinase/integrase [Microbulbifer salipaludis]|uniref:Tyrosine-type recombinase/integrase n=1 Tax=Microbulbifer salipaludis TaxID=187980 RepID=A0ABS3E815_9GAMM|nr:tyrosine-type recombinase/integrase [Microbulbifer salipaludis]MBN8431442.1 tyrosine-type recombinase/integrase [Microbulbifer salipaludis]
MKKIISTKEFLINGTPYPGFPLFYDNEHRLVKDVHRYLVKRCIINGRVKETSWGQYGHSLYDYFDWLEANFVEVEGGISIGDAWKLGCGSDDSPERSVLAQYRDWLLRPLNHPTHPGCGLAISTVNDRLGEVIRFYRYALRERLIGRPPFDLDEIKVRRPTGFLGHTDASQGVVHSPNVLLRNRRALIKVLSKHQIREFLECITNNKHKIFARLALGSGMRREELNTFPLKYVVNTAYLPKEKHWVRVYLDPRDMRIKGEQPRSILISRALMADLWLYVIHERPVEEVRSGKKQLVLFLNQQGKPYDVDHSSIAEGWKKFGLTYPVNLHTHRHTYATHTLYSLNRLKAMGKYKGDPILFVKNRLGHASIHTTMKYLHVLDDLDVEDLQFNHDLDLEELTMDDEIVGEDG